MRRLRPCILLLLGLAGVTPAQIPPVGPPGTPVVVDPALPYAFDLDLECGDLPERELSAFQKSLGQWSPLHLDGSPPAYHVEGEHGQRILRRWLVDLVGTDLQLRWALDSGSGLGACRAIMGEGYRARDRIHVVVPPWPEVSGTVRVESTREAVSARCQARNRDFPEQDAKVIECEMRLWLRDVTGHALSASGHRKLTVPGSMTSETSFSAAVERAEGEWGGSLGAGSSTVWTSSDADGFSMNLAFVPQEDPAVVTRSFGKGEGFDEWFALETGAEVHMFLEEKDALYDGTYMRSLLTLANRYRRVKIVCWQDTPDIPGVPGEPEPPPGVTREPPGGGQHMAGPDPDGAGEPGVRLELQERLEEGDRVAGVVHGGLGDHALLLQARTDPPGVIEIEGDALEVRPGVPDLLHVLAVAPGETTLELRVAGQAAPVLRRPLRVEMADPGRLELSFDLLRQPVGDLEIASVIVPATSPTPLHLQVRTLDASVCLVNGAAAAELVLPAGERLAPFVVRLCRAGATTLEVTLPRRGTSCQGLVEGYLPEAGGLEVNLRDAQVVGEGTDLVLSVPDALPGDVHLSFTLLPWGAGTLGGQASGGRRLPAGTPAGECLVLPLRLTTEDAVELEVSWCGALHGRHHLLLYRHAMGPTHLLDDLVRELAGIEGSAAGTFTGHAREARLQHALGQTERAARTLQHLLRGIDHTGWGALAHGEPTRARMRRAVQDTCLLLGLGPPRE